MGKSSTSWSKGQSGNKDGRPKKGKSIAEKFRENPKSHSVIDKVLMVANTLGAPDQHPDAMASARLVIERLVPSLRQTDSPMLGMNSEAIDAYKLKEFEAKERAQEVLRKLSTQKEIEEQRSQLNEASEDKPNETQPPDASEGVYENITATTHKKILIPVTYSDENEYAGWQAT